MFKDNVVITGECYELFKSTLDAFEAMVADYMPFDKYKATITSGRDGEHSDNSLHYKDKAIDVRIKDLNLDFIHCNKRLEFLVTHLGFVCKDKVFILHLYDGKDHLHIQHGRDNIVSFDSAIGENNNVFIK